VRRAALVGLASLAVLVPVVPALSATPTADPVGACSWGAKSDPDAVNVAYPDTNASYWLARYYAEPGMKLVVSGTYPKARYFSFHVYQPSGVPLDSLYDAQIAPDKGSANPFVAKVPTGMSRHYTLTVDFAAKPKKPAANTMYGGVTGISGAPNPAGLLMLRVYVPDNVKSAEGGVPLPKVTLETADGQPVTGGDACSNSLPKTGAGVNQAITSNSFPSSSPEQNPTAKPTWKRAYGNAYYGAFGNQQNAYLTASISRRFGDLVVIHGKAPRFPDTRRGVAPYIPSDVRYWSFCQNSNSTRVNSCAADFEAHVKDGYYTYVISDPSQRPANGTANDGVAWLPWGATDTTAVVIYRNMLVSPEFHHAVQDVGQGQDPKKVMGAYFPNAVYCSKAIFQKGGWKACFYRQ